MLRLKEVLRKDFAGLANEFHVWVVQLKADLLKDTGGELKDQLNDLKAKENEINNDTRLSALQSSHKQLEDAGIDENPYTGIYFLL